MIEKKYTLKFSGSNLHESVSYLLVSKFNIVPNVVGVNHWAHVGNVGQGYQ